jgi:hypothetical protein
MMDEVAQSAELEAVPTKAQSCVDTFKISCLQCHQFLMDIATQEGTEIRINCKSGDCRIYNLVQVIEDDGQIKLLHWLEPKPRSVRY